MQLLSWLTFPWNLWGRSRFSCSRHPCRGCRRTSGRLKRVIAAIQIKRLHDDLNEMLTLRFFWVAFQAFTSGKNTMINYVTNQLEPQNTMFAVNQLTGVVADVCVVREVHGPLIHGEHSTWDSGHRVGHLAQEESPPWFMMVRTVVIWSHDNWGKVSDCPSPYDCPL